MYGLQRVDHHLTPGLYGIVNVQGLLGAAILRYFVKASILPQRVPSTRDLTFDWKFRPNSASYIFPHAPHRTRQEKKQAAYLMKSWMVVWRAIAAMKGLQILNVDFHASGLDLNQEDTDVLLPLSEM